MVETFKQQYFVTAGSVTNTFAISSNDNDAYVTGFVGSNVIDYEGKTKTLVGPTNIFVAGINDGKQRFYKTAGNLTSSTFGFDVSASTHGVYATGIMRDPDFEDFSGVKRLGDSNPWVAKLDKNGNQAFFVNPNIRMIGPSKITHNRQRIIMGTFFSGSGTDLLSNPVNPNGSPSVALLGLDCLGNQKFFKYASASNMEDLVSSNAHCCWGCCGNPRGSRSNPKGKFQEGRAFVTGVLVIRESDNPFDFEGNPIIGLVPLKEYAYVGSVDNNGKQKYFKVAGENVIGKGITNQGNIAFPVGDLQLNANKSFSGLPILSDPARTGVYVSRLGPSGKECFFKVAQGTLLAIRATSNSHGVYLLAIVEPSVITDFNGDVVVPPASLGPWTLVAGLTHTGQQKFFVMCSGRPGAIDATEEAIFLTGTLTDAGSRDFNGDLIENTSGVEDIYVAALNLNGKQQFFTVAGGTSNDNGIDISAYKNRAFITGSINPPAIDFNGETVDPKGGGLNNFVSSLKLKNQKCFG